VRLRDTVALVPVADGNGSVAVGNADRRIGYGVADGYRRGARGERAADRDLLLTTVYVPSLPLLLPERVMVAPGSRPANAPGLVAVMVSVPVIVSGPVMLCVKIPRLPTCASAVGG
jgi:hypothetical protein